MLLDTVLRYHQSKHGKMFMASLDMIIAIDSVYVGALEAGRLTKGLRQPMIYYILRIYSESETKFEYDGWESVKIHPTYGVKQGDPMSPIFFSFIIDEMLKKVPSRDWCRN